MLCEFRGIFTSDLKNVTGEVKLIDSILAKVDNLIAPICSVSIITLSILLVGFHCKYISPLNDVLIILCILCTKNNALFCDSFNSCNSYHSSNSIAYVLTNQ